LWSPRLSAEYSAGAAAKRGVKAVGIDFAPSMVREARRNFPDARFEEGDAEALAFEAETFDAVVCGFGVGHLPDADKSLQEARRVLKRSGRYALSWWCTPDKHEFFTLVMGAVKKHGTFDVALPPAPPMYRFSEAAECARSLAQAGFGDVRVEEFPLVFEVEEPKQVLGLLSKSSVRMAKVLELQTQEALRRIQEEILQQTEHFKRGRLYRIGWPALVASGALISNDSAGLDHNYVTCVYTQIAYN
jgi:SAM-dependent methyltransferase